MDLAPFCFPVPVLSSEPSPCCLLRTPALVPPAGPLFMGLLVRKLVPFMKQSCPLEGTEHVLARFWPWRRPQGPVLGGLVVTMQCYPLEGTEHALAPLPALPPPCRRPQGPVFVGLVVRDHLMKLLLEAVKRGTCEHLEVGGRRAHQVLQSILVLDRRGIESLNSAGQAGASKKALGPRCDAECPGSASLALGGMLNLAV